MIDPREVEKALYDVTGELCRIIDDMADTWKKNYKYDGFKVRPGYGYDKFYMNRISGSYDMTLQSLIHYILYENKHYKRMFSKKTYKYIIEVVHKYPESLPAYEQEEEEADAFYLILFLAINHVKCCLEINGFDILVFEEEGYEGISPIPHISKCNVINDRIVNYSNFLMDLWEYKRKNQKFHDKDLEKIVDLASKMENIENLISLAGSVLPSKETAVEIIKIAILKASRKSEYTQLSLFIQNDFNDRQWAEDVLALKNKN